MLEFKKELEFSKLDIDTSYMFDIMFNIETEYVMRKGIEYKLAYVVATKSDQDSKIDLCLNIITGKDGYCTYSSDEELDEFENSSIMRKEIEEYLEKNIDEIKYTDQERIQGWC